MKCQQVQLSAASSVGHNCLISTHTKNALMHACMERAVHVHTVCMHKHCMVIIHVIISCRATCSKLYLLPCNLRRVSILQQLCCSFSSCKQFHLTSLAKLNKEILRKTCMCQCGIAIKTLHACVNTVAQIQPAWQHKNQAAHTWSLS